MFTALFFILLTLIHCSVGEILRTGKEISRRELFDVKSYYIQNTLTGTHPNERFKTTKVTKLVFDVHCT